VTEERYRLIDTICKITGTLAVVLGGGWSLISYQMTRADTLKNASIEARKPIFEKQLEACLTGVSLPNSVVSNPASSEEGKAARAQYEALFRGAFTVLADNDVYIPASNLSDCLVLGGCPDLAVRAFNLGEGCRKSLNDKWSTRLHAPAPAFNLKVTTK
jgi:hypothetical protein